ncbi:MAG: hypothetical protein ABIJ42_04140 [Acidobacteriota bacterium]
MTNQYVNRFKTYIQGINPGQLLSVFRLELKKCLFSKRILIPLFLASIPVVLMGIRFFVEIPEETMKNTVGGNSALYATVFRAFILRLLIFFACVAVFTRLVRGDLQEQVMHYYLLCPIRRDILLTGKYLAGVAAVGLCFMISVTASYLMHFQAAGSGHIEQFVLLGAGKAHLAAYLGITLLACFGYGAVFLLFGMLFKNPIIPSGVVLGLEYINFLLPPVMKKVSVIFYLESLCPVPIKESILSVAARPASWPVALLSLGLVVMVFLGISAWKFRKLQII